MSIERIHDGFTPQYEKYFLLAILLAPSETFDKQGPLADVRIGGSSLAQVADRVALEKTPTNAWFYEAKAKISYIKVFDPKEQKTVSAELRYV